VKTSHRYLRVGGFEVLEQSYTAHHRSPRHDHAAAEVCLVLDGSLIETVDHGGTLACHTGAASFKPAAAHHRVAAGAAGARCLVVTMPADRLRDATAAGSALRRPAALAPGALAGLGARLLRELAGGDAWAPLAVEGLALEVLAAAARHDRPADGGAGAHARVAPWVRACATAARRGGRPRRRAAVARGAGGGGGRGTDLPRPGVPPRLWNQRGRVRPRPPARARPRAAGDRERPLSDVALACGFYDQSHFTRLFRRETGVTPAAYRREHRPRECAGRGRPIARAAVPGARRRAGRASRGRSSRG
jgi:AraC family transcriptional regulator